MGAGKGQGGIETAAVNEQRRKTQALRHGGAGAVEPQIGNAAILDGESGADALVQQIPAEDELGRRPARLLRAEIQTAPQHGGLRLLPAVLPEIGIL